MINFKSTQLHELMGQPVKKCQFLSFGRKVVRISRTRPDAGFALNVEQNVCNVFFSISEEKVALNRGSGLGRFNATFPPKIKGKTLPVKYDERTRTK